MLDRLENPGYIARMPSGSDRRKIIIKRTDKDKALQQDYLKVSKEMADIFYKEFKNDEIFKFEGFLRKILNNLLMYENSKDQ